MGNNVDDAIVYVIANNGSEYWSGIISSAGGGIYVECNAGSFSGNNGGGTAISVNASKPGYLDGTASAPATQGNLSGCP